MSKTRVQVPFFELMLAKTINSILENSFFFLRKKIVSLTAFFKLYLRWPLIKERRLQMPILFLAAQVTRGVNWGVLTPTWSWRSWNHFSNTLAAFYSLFFLSDEIYLFMRKLCAGFDTLLLVIDLVTNIMMIVIQYETLFMPAEWKLVNHPKPLFFFFPSGISEDLLLTAILRTDVALNPQFLLLI